MCVYKSFVGLVTQPWMRTEEGGVFTAAELSLEIMDHLERLWSL